MKNFVAFLLGSIIGFVIICLIISGIDSVYSIDKEILCNRIIEYNLDMPRFSVEGNYVLLPFTFEKKCYYKYFQEGIIYKGSFDYIEKWEEK